MLSVSPKNRESQSSNGQDSWSKTFPTNLEEQGFSKEFVYRFVLLSSAMILEKRRLLPDSCFRRRVIEKLQISNYSLENEISKRLKTKIDSLKPALEQGYLAEFAIVFYRKPEEEDVFEVFSFKFAYKEDGKQVALSLATGVNTEEMHSHLIDFEFQSLDSIRQEFIRMMKILHRYVSRGLEDLPENSDGSFRIAYTSKAPADYCPEGFEKSENFYQINTAADGIAEVGVIGGGHHAVQIIGASLLKKANVADFNKTMASLEDSFFVQNKSAAASAKTPKATKSTSVKKTPKPAAAKPRGKRYGATDPIRGTPIPRRSRNADIL
ncbi:unnamed protein product [Caenorhabditis angaria]|uniref:HORMA domain-containing protein n=1 Tax=Caenorhabditis angaria TaxID=860376 RepID=A0A9P1N087_9PELO|nr:unnamed protein product [Caenorhabditis angaria]